MSDANEKDWSNNAGRGKGPQGVTKGSGVVSGLSENMQIGGNVGINPHGQGQRPAQPDGETMSRNGRKFKCE